MKMPAKKELLEKLLGSIGELDRPCPFFLYCANFLYSPGYEPLGNACCWGGTGNREVFRQNASGWLLNTSGRKNEALRKTAIMEGFSVKGGKIK